MPELTKPTTITEVAEEDWITAVTPVPSRTPFSGVLVSLYLSLIHILCGGQLNLGAAAHHPHPEVREAQGEQIALRRLGNGQIPSRNGLSGGDAGGQAGVCGLVRCV